MKRTQQEIDHVIFMLDKQKQKLPNFSAFGDNNWDAIDEQIEALKNQDDEDDIYEKGLSDHAENAAMAAVQWLNGDIEEDELY